MRVRILGCGTSSGVPRIGNDWGACDPAEPRNRRRRASILVEAGGVVVLVDTGPDMREQLLDAEVGRVDAVVWTHDHADHTHGIDDLRQLYHAIGRPVPGYARADCAGVLERRFEYVFKGGRSYPPSANLHLLPDRLTLGALEVRVIDQPHGRISSAGLVFAHGGRRAVYSTDFNVLTPEMRAAYEGCDLWIADALRHAPHPSHPTVAQTVEWAATLGAKRTVLTHMDHSLDYRTVAASLPTGVEPAYDGMELWT